MQQKKFQQTLHRVTKGRNLFGNVVCCLHGLSRFLIVLLTERDQFHEVVLHGETPVFITTAIAATVAEVESGSTFRETCLATEVQKSFTKPTMLLHGAMPPEICFAAP